MSQPNDYPPGVPCWVDTLQPDPEAAVRFYGDLMGWTFAGSGALPGEPAGRYPDDTAKKVEAAAGKVLAKPFDVPPAGRVAVFALSGPSP